MKLPEGFHYYESPVSVVVWCHVCNQARQPYTLLGGFTLPKLMNARTRDIKFRTWARKHLKTPEHAAAMKLYPPKPRVEEM